MVQWVLDYMMSNYPNARLSELLHVTMFLAAAGKNVPVTGVLLQELKQSYCMSVSRMLQCLFLSVRGLDDDLQRPS